MKWKLLIGIIAIILIFLYSPNIIRLGAEIIMPNKSPFVSSDIPLILVHGFQPSYSPRMAELELLELHNTLSETNLGPLTEITPCSEMYGTDRKVVVRMMYLTTDLKISSYAARLDEDIDRILECTGSEKINIIAYSMGGIVTRYYMGSYGEEKVEKVIMIGTPNQGGLYNIGEISNELDDYYSSIDFLELGDNSTLIRDLYIPKETPIITIAGDIDGKGDGLIEKEAVELDGFPHQLVPCNHLTMKSPTFCPQTLHILEGFLE